ncbi:MAG: thymidylate kinase [bacterium]|nr:thymidylate kinase [bacterium]
MKRGKLIVIDGTDGSGKATQTKLLFDKLKKNGQKAMIADFPQYGRKSASLVEEYLSGEFGSAEEVGPYRASVFYACDRYAASFKIKKFLDRGGIVISDRYVAANMGHQGGKIKSKEERKKYFKWLYDFEYEIFSIPKPDINIILHIDAALAQKLARSKRNKNYLKSKKRDIHEGDLRHLRDAEKIYTEIGKTFPGFAFIECAEKGKIMSKQKISDLIWKKVEKIIQAYGRQI